MADTDEKSGGRRQTVLLVEPEETDMPCGVCSGKLRREIPSARMFI